MAILKAPPKGEGAESAGCKASAVYGFLGGCYLDWMRYQNVCLESLGYTLPDEVLSSEEIEARLQPLYKRLRLPEGRLELMTGIRERRLWPVGTRPSGPSIESGRLAIQRSGIDPKRIGALVHGSVCRDFLEPATACGVHHHLRLAEDCVVYDVSNACLGLLSGMLQVANMIELGQIEAGLVVGTEDSRSLLETTIAELNRNTSLTREQMKLAVASLTIGSASSAVLLTHSSISRSKNRISSAAVRAHTQHHQLCQGGHADQPAEGTASGGILMQTDSEQLLQKGIATGVATFEKFLAESKRTAADFTKTICHQVGGAHRKLMLESLGLTPENDYFTFPWLGNTGSVALPISLALAQEDGFLTAGDSVALLGIGSGINCVMLSVDWQEAHVRLPQTTTRNVRTFDRELRCDC
ncbi:MAG: 3-oxoacyl-ACP synthase III [Pirellulales bacterium]